MPVATRRSHSGTERPNLSYPSPRNIPRPILRSPHSRHRSHLRKYLVPSHKRCPRRNCLRRNQQIHGRHRNPLCLHLHSHIRVSRSLLRAPPQNLPIGQQPLNRRPSRRVPPVPRGDRGSEPVYYAEDMLGSSRLLVNNTGAVCYDADFYPFGGERTVANTCAENYKFVGM